MLKRLDFLLASVLLAILCLPMLFIALGIFFILGRPVFFKQLRTGLHGKLFTIYKFRTMGNDLDNNGNVLPDADRITQFGQWLRRASLDELPQLLNIIKGDLSFIGPRPLLPEYLPLYSPQQYRRHDVKPGITGWAQAKGRNSLDWDKRFELDVWYVDNRKFSLYLKILFLTFVQVLTGKGINQDGHVSMTKFTGNQNSS